MGLGFRVLGSELVTHTGGLLEPKEEGTQGKSRLAATGSLGRGSESSNL